jgi:membrane fusion protein (multidrug efflux system)
MTLQAELNRNELLLHEFPETRSAEAWAPQKQPAADEPVVDSPPLHQGREPANEAERADQPRGGLLRRHPFAFALGVLLLIPTVAASYLYWDYSLHFESTDDAFVAGRAFSIQPQVAGYITAVPVTDNQHVAAGDVIARIDDRDYRAAPIYQRPEG